MVDKVHRVHKGGKRVLQWKKVIRGRRGNRREVYP
jgi:hypothetical protein